MSDQLPSLVLAISRFLDGEAGLHDLEDVVVPMGEDLPGEDLRLNEIWGSVELALAELTSGVIDEPEVRARLSGFAPIRTHPQPYYVATSSTTQTISLDSFMAAAWLMNLRVAHTPVETGSGSPVGHPA